MDHKTKIAKARTALILEQPFFGSLAMRLTVRPDSSIDTISTNGKELRYNPAWIMEQQDHHLKAIVAHEIMHLATLHHTRRQGRDLKEWNIAADFAINPILQDSGFSLPSDALLDAQYHDMAAEAIYGKRHKDGDDPGDQQQPQQQPGSDQQDSQAPGDCGGTGSFEDLPTESESEKREAESEMRLAVKQAAQAAKNAGKLPGSLARFADEIVNPKLPWQEVLRRFCDSIARDDYSWSRPNRRHIASGLYLPSVRSEQLPPFVIAIDTSGSIGQEELNDFAAEIQSIADDCPISSIKTLYCDATVYEGREFGKGDRIELDLCGGGGTDFRPVFDWVAEHDLQPAALVYLTDGYGRAPDSAPDYPVLWTITAGGRTPAAWGETIELE